MNRLVYYCRRLETRSKNLGLSLENPRLSLKVLIQLRVVAKCLSFQRAAASLGVTQSRVGARMEALEKALGIILFERHRGGGIHMTEAGRRFVIEISAGIERLELAIQTAGGVPESVKGSLRIALQSSISAGFLADLFSQFREKFPAIEPILSEGGSSDTTNLVRQGKLDIAFIMGGVNNSGCHSRQFWSETWVAVLPLGHPALESREITWQTLASERFFVQRGGAGPQVLTHIARRVVECGKPLHIDQRDVGRDTLMHMVAAGDGITLTTAATTHVAFPGITFRTIADETEQANFCAVWSPQNRNPAMRSLLGLASLLSRQSSFT